MLKKFVSVTVSLFTIVWTAVSLLMIFVVIPARWPIPVLVGDPSGIARQLIQHQSELTGIALSLILLVFVSSYWFVSNEITRGQLKSNTMALKQFLAMAESQFSKQLLIIKANLETLGKTPQNNISQELSNIALSRTQLAEMVDYVVLLGIAHLIVDSETMPIVNLESLTLDVFYDFRARFREKGILLIAEETEEIEIAGEQQSLGKMLSCIMSNALRYTNPGNTVKVSLTRHGNEARLSVSDNGIGISPENLQRVFEPFFRVNKFPVPADSGQGLGLTLAKAVAQAHRGRIDVESTLGTGSTFTIILPVAT
jgi:signal transduction histidine kinase